MEFAGVKEKSAAHAPRQQCQSYVRCCESSSLTSIQEKIANIKDAQAPKLYKRWTT